MSDPRFSDVGTATARVVEERAGRPSLYSVFIDTECGWRSPPRWERNSVPKPLADALEEAAECRRREFPAKVEPDA